MKQAYSYIRFSSAKQELGDSLRRQMKLAEDYATKHDLVLDNHSYRDLGVSAFKGKNAVEGSLNTFIKAVETGAIQPGSYLLVESLDRMSRDDVQEALTLFMHIIKLGVVLVTVADGQVYSKASVQDNWTKLIVALAIMSRANNESKTKSDRLLHSWDPTKRRCQSCLVLSPYPPPFYRHHRHSLAHSRISGSR